MHIAFLALQANPFFEKEDLSTTGGAELQVFLLARALAKRGHKVTMVTQRTGSTRRCLADGIHVHATGVRSGPVTGLRVIPGAFRALVSARADVYVQRAAGIDTWICERAARVVSAPFVYMGASDSDTGDALPYDRRRRIHHRYYSALGRASLVIAQSTAQAAGFQTKTQAHVVHMRSICDMRAIEPNADRSGVLWVARCRPYKRPESLIALATMLPTMSFIALMPKGPDPAYDASIRTRLASLSNVELHDGVPYRATAAFFNRASLLLNTSQFEGFPNTFLQAASTGIPVVSQTVDPDGYLSVMGAGVCGFDDLDATASALQDLESNPGLRHQHAKRAQAFLKANHGEEHIANELLEHLESARDAYARRRSNKTANASEP